ncbi:MAG TPA: HipA family kinase [Terriglobales bacterium]|nr:HipA family kinase [Terriglobales bacterium]
MPIQAVEHIRGMRGGAQSHLMRASDDHYYVVKFTNNPQHRRVLANEWLVARLARRMGLPVPEMALVDVAPDVVAGSPGLHFRVAGKVVPCDSGLQFGSRLPTADPHAPIYDYLPEEALELVANLDDFIGMLVLDKWTCNCNGRQVIYCRVAPRRQLKVFMVDQGFCFDGGSWKFPDSPLRGVFSRNRVYNGVRGLDSFEPWLTRVEMFDEASIYAAGEEVPPEWYGAWDDMQRLLEHLIKRRTIVRDLLLEVKASQRKPFDNWVERAAGAAQGQLYA